MPRRAKMGELKRAGQALGVTSTTLREQGWKTASAHRIERTLADPPAWLIDARTRCAEEKAKVAADRDRSRIAARLGIRQRAVAEHNLAAVDVEGLLAAPPPWLVDERQRRAAHLAREAADRKRRDERELELADALLRAYKDGGDTDSWAAAALHNAGIHTIVDADGDTAPVLPPALRLVPSTEANTK